MKVRQAALSDRPGIESVYLAAFGSEERASVAQLAVDLVTDAESFDSLSFVSSDGEEVLGHVAFSPLVFDSGNRVKGSILSPLAVAPRMQGKGIGSGLVKKGLERLRMDGNDVVLVYGDPNYYGRFGFRDDVARTYQPPYPLQYPLGWLGLKLRPLDSGDEVVRFTCVKPLSRPDLW